jgi:hypothetical protein
MDIQKCLNDQNIEAVQDRKDGKDYWMYDNLYTEIDLIELLEAFSLHVVSQQRELLIAFSECVVKDVTIKGHEEVVDYFLKKHKAINCG